MSDLILLDRTITIEVTATSNWLGSGPDDLGANVSYRVTASTPNYPNPIDVDGNLYLGRMSNDKKYTDNLDITLILNSQMTQRDGTPLAARWALPSEGSGNYVSPEGFCWFCASKTDWAPIPTPPGISLIRNSDTSITIDDNSTDNGLSYRFCMGLMVPPLNHHFITIEPAIVGKGATLPPTSAKLIEQCD